jgi:hypothetical protein
MLLPRQRIKYIRVFESIVLSCATLLPSVRVRQSPAGEQNGEQASSDIRLCRATSSD